MPLIRMIGDRGTLSKRRMPCGRRGQILEEFQPQVDAFRTQDGTLIDGEYFTHLLYFETGHKFQVFKRSLTDRLQIVKSDSDGLAHE
jgi:hypothetical protein